LPPDSLKLDAWLPDPAVRVAHRRESSASPECLWRAAHEVRLTDTRVLGPLVRWRIPGLPTDSLFYDIFRQQPFLALTESDGTLMSGLVGRIWTLRRDYPELEDTEQYQQWSRPGTAKVLFANWVEPGRRRRSTLRSEVRVQAFGAQGRIGLTTVRPLIRAFQHLVGTEALATAVRRAERG
jgi:hypothetical protein